MSYEEEFDKIVRQKAEEADYPFDAENWGKARMMIDTERKAASLAARKSLVMPAAVIAGAVATLFLAYSYFSSDNSSALSQNTTVGTSSVSSQSQNSTIQSEKVPSFNSNTALSQNETHQSISQDNQPAVKETNHELATVSHAPPKIHEQDAVYAGPSSNKSNASTPASENAVNLHSEKTNAAIKLKTDGSSKTGETATPEATSTEKQEDRTNTLAVAAGAHLNASTTQPKVVMVPAASADKEVNTAQELMSESLKANESEEAQILKTERMRMRESTLPDDILDNEVVLSPFVLLDRYKDDYFSPKYTTHLVNIEAGANYLAGWNTSNGKDGKGLNWFAGLNYKYYLTNKLSVGAGIQLYEISHIAEPFYSGKDKEYSFGYTETYTEITANNLLYASVPLRFAFDVNRKHQFGLGLHAGYLLQSQNTTKHYQIKDGVREELAGTSTTAVYEGLSTYNLMGGIFYKAQLNRRFALQTEFTFGLTDLFNNSGDINRNEKPMGMRLGLQYTLFEK